MYNNNVQKQLHDFYLNDLTSIDTTHNNAVKNKHPEYWNFDRKINNTVFQFDQHNIWFWSDTHFNHKNIIKYSNRPFTCIEHMNTQMINDHNQLVKSNDIVIWCGDVGFGKEAEINNILNQCNGYKILIVGNHDMTRGGRLYKLNFDEIHPCLVLNENDVSLWITHYPLDSVPPNTINVHGHIHTHNLEQYNINVSVEQTEYKPISIDSIMLKATEYIKSKKK